MIIALAGRRIDAPDAPNATFPLERVEAVREALRAKLSELGAAALVSSAACGADLVALDIARELGIRARIILPFSREAFRRTSVTDRPGDDWGRVFDAICDAADARGDLVVLDVGGPSGGDAAYLAANEAILDEAARLAGPAGPSGVRVLLVWRGPRTNGTDATAAFAEGARRRGMPVEEIATG